MIHILCFEEHVINMDWLEQEIVMEEQLERGREEQRKREEQTKREKQRKGEDHFSDTYLYLSYPF